MAKARSIEDRFWEKVEIIPFHSCWEWTGAKSPCGYGMIRSGGYGGVILASRKSFEMRYGEIPKLDGYHGACVCHTCDNRGCVNPDHLFIGTHKDNCIDKARKNRQVKIASDIVNKIKSMHAAGVKQKDIAICFGVSHQHVSRIVNLRQRATT